MWERKRRRYSDPNKEYYSISNKLKSQGKITDDMIRILYDRATELLDDDKLSKKYDHSMNLAGNVKQEVRFPPAWLISTEFAPMNTSLQMIIEKY